MNNTGWLNTPKQMLVAGGLSSLLAFSASAADLTDALSTGGAAPRLYDQLKPAPKALDLTIPPRKERPVDLDAGPQFDVDVLNLYQLIPSKNIKRLVSDDVVVEMLMAAMVENNARFTLGRLQQLADKITNYYRAKGLVLATAYVPAQDVVNNTVELHLLMGELTDIEVSGDSSYDAEMISRVFSDQIGKPLNKSDIESSLLTVLDYPGLDISGILEPGDQVGSTKMLINVNSEDRVSGALYLDNKGSQYSGEERLGLDFSVNNPLGLADKLTLNFIIQNKPEVDGDFSVDNAKYSGATYEFSPVDSDYIASLHYHQSDYEIGRDLAAFAFAGKSKQWKAGLKKQLGRSRTRNSYVKGELVHDRVKNTQASVQNSADKLTALVASYGYDFSDNIFGGGFTRGEVSVEHGFAGILGAMDNDDENASRITSEGPAPADYNLIELNLSRYQRLSENNALIVKFNAQYSPDSLFSVKQFSMGGFDSVRAYPSGEYLADSGFYTGLELISNAPGFASRPAFNNRTWGEVLQLMLFADYAHGYKNNALLGEESQIDLSGLGVGLRLMPAASFTATLSVATPLGGRKATNNRDPQVYGELNYLF
ncbi:ShlB/FhaC/HecB family hemolysin secretion/activation protein [Amphritea pacifica]|uniref:ShlB/FhaC/HecB family hemolysin secretion/activation protein n=1 Tax=Amphritea pacifica TaxID=2811233 RepID=A0ABS2W5U0_9GAMM|nr:ShlB/FhaC/HecB family hemolysin secretion/activation protein [Amphritea pacifica]MBN0986908.1 ShlB/FhaC/HecB family hemolysin secretion/activation protein [Amphritea pacifica]MBN1005361.1 ShlB/FhaC/HecB family hemolysin secretion/activation protein [Amphritea pacifica]